MKKSVVLGLFLFVFVIGLGFVSAATCSLDTEMINQDPYPAMPDDYVKVVFQISGIENPDCGKVTFELLKEYPFTLDSGRDYIYSVNSGTFVRDYESFFLAAYRIRVDEDALEGENEMRAKITHNVGPGKTQAEIIDFNITVEDVRTDFEISVKDIDFSTNIITFEILNIGENDVRALTVEIPKQDTLNLKGGNRNIVGDLDSGEDTTFSFEAFPSNGEIELRILYNDEIDVRRDLMKNVSYDSSFFTDRKGEEITPKPTSYYVSVVLVILIILMWIRGWWKKKQKKKRLSEERRRK